MLKVSVKQNHGISHNGTRVARNQIEPRKKPLLYYFPLYWLVNRGPYNGLIPIYLGSIIPLYNPTNQGFFHCSILTPMFLSKLSGRVFSFSLFHAASAVDGVRRPLSRFGLGPFEATARSLCGGESRESLTLPETKEQHKHRHIRWDVTF